MDGANILNGTQVTVGSTAVQLVAANGDRAGLLIQSVTNACRVGAAGVTATTGFPLAAGESIVFAYPTCPRNAIYAIRDGGSDATVLVQEITV